MIFVGVILVFVPVHLESTHKKKIISYQYFYVGNYRYAKLKTVATIR